MPWRRRSDFHRHREIRPGQMPSRSVREDGERRRGVDKQMMTMQARRAAASGQDITAIHTGKTGGGTEAGVQVEIMMTGERDTGTGIVVARVANDDTEETGAGAGAGSETTIDGTGPGKGTGTGKETEARSVTGRDRVIAEDTAEVRHPGAGTRKDDESDGAGFSLGVLRTLVVVHLEGLLGLVRMLTIFSIGA